MIRLWPVQQAIYGLLSSDSTFMGMITGLLDEPDVNQRFPYVSIGPGTGTPDDLLVETGGSHTAVLDFWDRDAPVSRVKQIMFRATQVIHGQRPSMSGAQVTRCDVEYEEVIRDVDTIHGIMRVRMDTFG
jgi:hypothetical protein